MPKNINIKGDIIPNDYAWIYDWMEWDYTCPRQIENALNQANGGEVIFLINSGGGSVFDGYEIFNLIKGYTGKTTAKIVGVAASAASFIAMAANTVQASALSQIMIHRAANGNQGNAPSHRDNASFLEQVDNTIVKAYTMRNKKTDEEMIALMDKTTWFTAEQALEVGIIDEIINNDVSVPKVYNSLENKQEVIDKLINLGSVENMKKALLNKNLGISGVTNTIDNINTNSKEEEIMTVDKLKQEHPSIYNQIVEDAQKEAVTNERSRIKAIQNLSVQGVEDVIDDGIERGLSAGEVAINIINAQKKIGENHLQNVMKDANESGINNISNEPAPQNSDKNESVNILVAAGQKIMGGRR
ncbi:Clp protease ClpP [Niameybacter massiliensis]|uniref:ATP-dependent Clp protease proteolytic subunit n=1 Tax=Holtiella tumoricola TaxID=3018743 RepID=A0AA42J1H1_9FIRM|nr:head maturation protease, ClpP-related [Holtiella tumoricola]MDA3732380.1 Clp protease ClpP [Holtiella tumoricola]